MEWYFVFAAGYTCDGRVRDDVGHKVGSACSDGPTLINSRSPKALVSFHVIPGISLEDASPPNALCIYRHDCPSGAQAFLSACVYHNTLFTTKEREK